MYFKGTLPILVIPSEGRRPDEEFLLPNSIMLDILGIHLLRSSSDGLDFTMIPCRLALPASLGMTKGGTLTASKLQNFYSRFICVSPSEYRIQAIY